MSKETSQQIYERTRGSRKKVVGSYFGKDPLTPKQQKIYAWVAGYIQDNGYSPTDGEISEKMKMSTQMVGAHIKNIVNKGWLKFNGKKFRRISLIPE